MAVNFSENVEALESVILAYILHKDDDYVLSDESGNQVESSKLINAIQPSFFSNQLYRDMVDQIKQFRKKYGEIPSKEELSRQFDVKNIEYSKLEYDEVFNINLFKYTKDYLYGYLHSFLVVKTINNQFNKVTQHLALSKPDPENIDSIFEYVRNELSANLEVDITSENEGLDVYDFKSHIQPKKNTKSTGNSYLDLVLGGGWEPKTLVCFFGRPKIGKSLVISNLAVRTASLGAHVGIYSVELGDSKYVKRIGSNMFAIPFTYYNDFVDESSTKEIQPMIDSYLEKNPNAGTIVVKEAPTGASTVYDIENYFLKEQKKRGIHFDTIFVDYVNLLKCADNSKSDNLYAKIKNICEGLRKIAQRNEWCVVTATQANKSSFTTDDLQLDSVAESAGLVATVDTLIGLSSDSEEQLKMKTVANRDNGHMGSYAMFVKNFDYYRLEEDTAVKGSDDYMFNLDNTKDLLKNSVKKNYDINKAKQWTADKNTEFLIDGEKVFRTEQESDVVNNIEDLKQTVVLEQVVEATPVQPNTDMPFDDGSDIKYEDFASSDQLDPFNTSGDSSNNFKIETTDFDSNVSEYKTFTTNVESKPVATEVKEEPAPVKKTLLQAQPDESLIKSWKPEPAKEEIKEEPAQEVKQFVATPVSQKEVKTFDTNSAKVTTNVQEVTNEQEKTDISDKKTVEGNFSSKYLVNTFGSQYEHDSFIKTDPENVASVLLGINSDILKSNLT